MEQEPISREINDIQKKFFSELVKAYIPHKTEMTVGAVEGDGEYHDLIESGSAAHYSIGELMTIDLFFSTTTFLENGRDFVTSMWQVIVSDKDPQPDGSEIVKSSEYTVMAQGDDWTADHEERTQIYSSESEIIHSDDHQKLTGLVKQANRAKGIDKQNHDATIRSIYKHISGNLEALKQIEDNTFTAEHLNNVKVILDCLDPAQAEKT